VATSVTVSGSSQLPRNLYVYVGPDIGCGQTPNDETSGTTALASGTAIGSGAFSQTYSYTPASANTYYEICAYVDDNYLDTPDADNYALFSTSPPAMTAPIPAPTTSPTTPTQPPVTHPKPKLALAKPPTTRSKPKAAVHRGPSGPIAVSRSGHIGSLAINRSTAAAIRGVWGSPDYTRTGNVDSGTHPDYIELGYACHPSRGFVTCATSFFVSRRTHLLESFTTTSPRFTLFGGVHVGMASNVASVREHEPNLDGCGQGIYVNTPDLFVILQTRGGHAHLTGHRELVSGGSVSEILIDQRHLGVGVNAC
jgi:hypothetical protein